MCIRDRFQGALTFLYCGATGTFEPQVTTALKVAGTHWKKDSWFGISYPHTLEVSSPVAGGRAVSTGSLLNMAVYNRCSVAWTPQPAAPGGTGWVEYFHLAAWLRWPAFIGARVQSFFMRQFPWFGR